MQIAELPLLPATVFDRVLNDPDTPNSGIKKARQALRKKIGLGSEGFLSLGHRGSMQLDPIPLFSCAKTQRYWGQSKVDSHVEAFRNARLPILLRSRQYKNVVSVATKEIQAEIRRGDVDDVLTTTIRVLSQLFMRDAQCRQLAVQMEEINDKVDEALPQVERRPGELVRFEGDEALFVLHGQTRDELRLLPAALFTSTGLSEGASFILQEFSWTADATARLVVPAVSFTPAIDDATLEELSRSDSPLPRPG